MADQYVMALDQGTTSSRCIIFDRSGNIVSMEQREFEQIFPQPGWVEHNPMEIWSSQIGVAMEALSNLSIAPEQITAIGITNQRESTIVWDRKTGKPVYNAIVWQCRRTASMIDALTADEKAMIKARTGLQPDAYFSASKIKWILDNVPGARQAADEGSLAFGTVDSWLMWNLSGGSIHATDYTNASRTMIYNIHELRWDDELLELFGIPKSMLPKVHPSGYRFGMTREGLFGKSLPISGVAGDQQSSLFGLGCWHKGDVKNTYGTGCFLLMNTGKEAIESRNGLVTTIAAGRSDNVDYVLEGSVFIGGAVIKWLRDELKVIDSASESEWAASQVEDTAGVYLVPAFTGIGAPYWNQDMRGTMVGMTRGFGKNQLIRAALESIAYQSDDVIKAMEADLGQKMKALNVDGGAAANNLLMQFQSDITAATIRRPGMLENTALGAAYLAGLTEGFWRDEAELLEDTEGETIFEPQMAVEIRTEKIKGWHRAVRTAACWTEEE